jgi:squalene-hopene/tetraprenyl-beta-curcumene cyclase
VTSSGDGPTEGISGRAAQLAAALTAPQRASRLLLTRQDSQGWWSGGPEGETPLDAEGLLVREFLGIRAPELTKAVAQQIRSLQRADGSWAGTGEPGRTGGPSEALSDGPADLGESGYASDLSASVMAYLALRLAGDSPDAYHMAVAAGWIRDAGGLPATALSVQVWLASFGLADWGDVPVPLPEVIYLPARRNPGLGAWSGWSRPALISLAITGAMRPVRPLPFSLTALHVPVPAATARAGDWRRCAGRGLRAAPMTAPGGGLPRPRDRWPCPQPARPARSLALRTCGQWLVRWQSRGGTDQSRPVWPGSLVALHLLGYPLHHPVMADGLAWLDSVAPRLRPAGAQPHPAGPRRPPVRDTALAVGALAHAGLAADHPALVAGGRWLLGQWVGGLSERPGQRSDAAPSGWTFRNDGYPNIADTARVLLALGRVRLPGQAGQPVIGTALRWLASMQGRDGGWGGSAVVTALVTRALATHALAIQTLAGEPSGAPSLAGEPSGAPSLAADGPAGSRAVRRGVVFLLRAQRADGSWPGGRRESDVDATATVLPALLTAGVLPGKSAIADAADWLASRQSLDADWPSGRPAADGIAVADD